MNTRQVLITKNQFNFFFVCPFIPGNLPNGRTKFDATFSGRQMMLPGVTEANFTLDIFFTSAWSRDGREQAWEGASIKYER